MLPVKLNKSPQLALRVRKGGGLSKPTEPTILRVASAAFFDAPRHAIASKALVPPRPAKSWARVAGRVLLTSNKRARRPRPL